MISGIILRLSLLCSFIAMGIATNNNPSFANLGERRTAAKAMQRAGGLNPDLDLLIQRFTPNDDWLALENALVENEKTCKLLKLVREHRRDLQKTGRDFLPRMYWSADGDRAEFWTVSTPNKPNKIEALDLRGLGLTEDDLDLSKLPQGLISLDLSENNLQDIKMESLPKSLQRLMLQGNNLKEVDLTSCHPALKYVEVSRQQIRNIWVDPLRRLEIKVYPWNRDGS